MAASWKKVSAYPMLLIDAQCICEGRSIVSDTEAEFFCFFLLFEIFLKSGQLSLSLAAMAEVTGNIAQDIFNIPW